MACYILDTNIYIYLLTGNSEYLERVQARISEARDGGHTIFLPVAVVAELLYVLEGSEFGYSREEATHALQSLVLSPDLECQDRTAVLYGLEMHREKNLDFVDAYCAGLAREPETLLVTNDRDIAEKSESNVIGI